ncbi:MAG: D-alanyl-D-alanine carboxypeptidase [Firmicutes bacterium]|nr:D-alanyl-D-alanine carboxypeptidase [Bacillota bacterium]
MKKRIYIVFLLCLCMSVIGWYGYEKNYSAETSALLAPIVSAKGAILIDAADGSVIYEKNADQKLYPASTTKIMTALIALEVMEEIDADFESTIVVPKEAAGIEGSSLYLKAGEKVSVEELLYGMMLQSGNDAATAIAICMGGNVENFVKLMNEKADELGCRNTHFVNSSGLYDENHYTTARDLAIIACEAMKNTDFRKVVAAPDWAGEDSGRKITNKNKTIHQYDGATGIKIGYTRASGRTLVASAKRGNKELIAVMLSAPDWFKDGYALMDYGFMREESKK